MPLILLWHGWKTVHGLHTLVIALYDPFFLLLSHGLDIKKMAFLEYFSSFFYSLVLRGGDPFAQYDSRI